MSLSSLVNQISSYEAGLFKQLKTSWDKTRLQLKDKEELQYYLAWFHEEDTGIAYSFPECRRAECSLREDFELCEHASDKLRKIRQISLWDTSKVTDMSLLFYRCKTAIRANIFRNFNQNINNWDVSNVDNMFKMFYDCHAFNQSLNHWDTSNVIVIHGIFETTPFDQDISCWDVSRTVNHVRFSGYNQINGKCELKTYHKPNIMGKLRKEFKPDFSHLDKETG